MKVALLHIDVAAGPESRNLDMLAEGIRLAAQAGAKWIVTPETAVQGYFFACERDTKPVDIPIQPSLTVKPLLKLAARLKVTVFLCCAERALTGKYYNSCLVIGSDGKELGRHRKKHAHGGTSEGWASKGTLLETFVCGDRTAGILICADSWYENNAVTLADKGAEIIVVPAAWPPYGCGGPPENAWKRASAASGLALWVCNQAGGHERLDFSQAQSAVIVGGEMWLEYSGPPAVLVFDWDFDNRRTDADEFTLLTL